MKDNYIIVLFKNRKRKKIIKRYVTEKQATNFFNRMIKENNVVFEKRIENAEPSDYELGLLSKNQSFQPSLYITDDYGRNSPVNLENPEYVFLNIKKYKVHNRKDAIFVKDVSSAQRKWLYDIMEKKGFDKKRLYRLKTTFSKR